MKTISDLVECPTCSKLSFVRVIKVFGECSECFDRKQFDDTTQIINTVHGSKVYYAYQEALSKHQALFEGGADGGVVANSSLPPSLNALARYFAVMYLTKHYNLNDKNFSKCISNLGNMQVSMYLRDIFFMKVQTKYPTLYKKYDSIGDIK